MHELQCFSDRSPGAQHLTGKTFILLHMDIVSNKVCMKYPEHMGKKAKALYNFVKGDSSSLYIGHLVTYTLYFTHWSFNSQLKFIMHPLESCFKISLCVRSPFKSIRMCVYKLKVKGEASYSIAMTVCAVSSQFHWTRGSANQIHLLSG